MFRRLCALVFVGALLAPASAAADTGGSRFNAGGYMRVMARPDLQGGNGSLGFWNLYGRLLNEGPYAALELRYDMLPQDPLGANPWTSIHAKIEGGSVTNADPALGSLGNFRLSQLYAQTGNVLVKDVTFQIGTLDSYFPDLGLYDFRPAQIFIDTVGLSTVYRKDRLEILLAIGDAGFAYKGFDYNTILTAGGSVKVGLGDHVQIGAGGQYYYEPKVEGNRFAPHNSVYDDGSGGLDYEEWVRGEITANYFQDNPTQSGPFTRPVPTSTDSFKVIGYFGFGNLGPLIWNNLSMNFLRRHALTRSSESLNGEEFEYYIEDLTDERYELNIGNEMQLRLIPRTLDLTWALYYGRHYDEDNEIVVSDSNRELLSTVARFQLYFTETVHLLLEGSAAAETSTNGNFIRTNDDSVFESNDGRADPRGLEFGDAETRNTYQIKAGPVLQPLGLGIFTRPSFRVLYGGQYSNQVNAFGNGFVDSLDDFNVFGTQNVHWHHVLSLEVEAWF